MLPFSHICTVLPDWLLRVNAGNRPAGGVEQTGVLAGAGRGERDMVLEAFLCGTVWRGLRKCGGNQAETSRPGIT